MSVSEHDEIQLSSQTLYEIVSINLHLLGCLNLKSAAHSLKEIQCLSTWGVCLIQPLKAQHH